MELTEAIAFARDRRQGVLVTIRRDGRPQISNILYLMDDSGRASISTSDDRAKVKHLRRDPRASLYVLGDSFWAWAVLEGTVEVSPVAAQPDDEVVEELVAYYREAQGEHPDWDEYRQAMVAERRVVVRLVPERAYGILG
jgi:PPOX class probable F420-dependent enzyme